MDYLKKHWLSILAIGIIGALTLLSFFIDLEGFKEWVEGTGVWAPIFYILAKASTVIFAPLSGTALYIFSVPLFGFWKGILYSFIGDFIGATVTFYLSRFFGRPVVQYFAGKKNMQYIESALDIMSTFKGFMSIRLATVAMPEVASYAAGLTKLKFPQFIVIHMIIDLIPIIVMTLPGLLFSQSLPVWFAVVVITGATFVTLFSIIIFTRMIKRDVAEKSLIKSVSDKSDQKIY